MKLAFTTLGCPGWDMDAILACAREYGYDGVDFRGYLGTMDLYTLPEFKEQAHDTAARFADAGLAVPCFSSSVRIFAKPDAAEAETLAYARLCQLFRAPFIRVFAGHFRKICPESEAVRVAADTLRRCLPIARDHGVRLLVETHDDWMDSVLVRRLMESVASPQAGVLWDVHHPYRMLGEEPETTWTALGPWIAYTHVKDSLPGVNDKGEKDFRYCLTGDGDIPLARILATLRDGGYDGWLTYEWEKVWHPDIPEPEQSFPVYVRHIRALLAEESDPSAPAAEPGA